MLASAVKTKSPIQEFMIPSKSVLSDGKTRTISRKGPKTPSKRNSASSGEDLEKVRIPSLQPPPDVWETALPPRVDKARTKLSKTRLKKKLYQKTLRADRTATNKFLKLSTPIRTPIYYKT